jgi:hypothetical protein
VQVHWCTQPTPIWRSLSCKRFTVFRSSARSALPDLRPAQVTGPGSAEEYAEVLAAHPRARENQRRLAEWRRSTQAYFAETINTLNRRHRDELRRSVQGSTVAEVGSARRSARLQRIGDCFSVDARLGAIVDLAVRAGFIREDVLREASESEDAERLTAIARDALDSYDNSLGIFLDCYQYYQAQLIVKGREATGNDLSDLDQLVLMKESDTAMVFVTPDAFLAEVTGLAHPGRSTTYEAWIADVAGDRQRE